MVEGGGHFTVDLALSVFQALPDGYLPGQQVVTPVADVGAGHHPEHGHVPDPKESHEVLDVLQVGLPGLGAEPGPQPLHLGGHLGQLVELGMGQGAGRWV